MAANVQSSSTRARNAPGTSDGESNDRLKSLERATEALCRATGSKARLDLLDKFTKNLDKKPNKEDSRDLEPEPKPRLGDILQKLDETTLKIQLEKSSVPPTTVISTGIKQLVKFMEKYRNYIDTQSVVDLLIDTTVPFSSRLKKFKEYCRQGSLISKEINDVLFQILLHFIDLCTSCAYLAKTSRPTSTRKRFKRRLQTAAGCFTSPQQTFQRYSITRKELGIQKHTEAIHRLLDQAEASFGEVQVKGFRTPEKSGEQSEGEESENDQLEDEHSADDLIDWGIDRLCEFQIGDNEKDDERRSKLSIKKEATRDELREKAAGNYRRAKHYLHAIARARDYESIQKILQDKDTELIKQAVNERNKELSEEQIDDLNEIFSWLFLAEKHWHTINHLESVLRLKYGSPVPLKKRIEEKYYTLLSVSDNKVITGVSKTFFEDWNGTQSFSISKNIRKTREQEVSVVRRAIKSVCDDELFHKIGLGKPLNEYLRKLPLEICFDKGDGHMRIILCLLKATSVEHRENAKPLHRYAVEHMLEHINKVDSRSLDLASNSMRKEIGRYLYCFFMHESCVRIWLTEDRLELVLSDKWWKSLDGVFRWFRDPMVQKGAEKVAGGKQNLMMLEKEDLFAATAKILASEWLLKPQWDVENTLKCIFKLPVLPVEIKPMEPENTRRDSGAGSTLIPMENVAHAETWARTLLKVEEACSVCQVRIAETLSKFGHWTAAEERCRRILEKEPHNWRAAWFLAQAQERQSSLEDALAGIDKIIEEFLANPHLRVQHQALWNDMLSDREDLYEKLKGDDETIRVSQELLKRSPDEYAVMQRMLARMEAKSDYPAITEVLLSLREGPKGNHCRRLSALFSHCADDIDFHLNLCKVVRDHPTIPDLFIRGYAGAMKMAAGNILAQTHLAACLGRAHLYKQDEGRALATFEAALKDRRAADAAHDPYGLTPRLRLAMAGFVCTIYMQRAKYEPMQDDADSPVAAYIADVVANDVYGTRPQPWLVGRILHLMGQDADAKLYIRDFLRRALRLLDDGIDSNDWQAYVRLARAFTALDDNENALAAWSLVVAPKDAASPTDNSTELQTPSDSASSYSTGTKEDEAEEEGEVSGVDTLIDPSTPTSSAPPAPPAKDNAAFDEESDQILNSGCSAVCGHAWGGRISADVWVCRDCMDTVFDEDCYHRLQADALNEPIAVFCRPSHSFLHVPKCDEEQEKKAQGGRMVAVGSGERAEWIRVEEWVQRVKETYLLEM